MMRQSSLIRKFKKIGINITPGGVWRFNDEGVKDPVDAWRKDGLAWDGYRGDNMSKFRPELSGHYVLDLDDLGEAEKLLPAALWEKAMSTFRYNTTSKNKMHCIFKRVDEAYHKRVIWSLGAFDSMPNGNMFTGHLLGTEGSAFELFDGEVLDISSEEIAAVEALIPMVEREDGGGGWEIVPYPSDTVVASVGLTLGEISSGEVAIGTRCGCPFEADHTNGGEGYGFITDGYGVGCNSCHQIMVAAKGGTLDGEMLDATDVADLVSSAASAGASLEGETLAVTAAEVRAEVVEFVLSDVYQECLVSAVGLVGDRIKFNDAMEQIKKKFKVTKPELVADFKEVYNRTSTQNFLYPDYEFTQQGEIKYLGTMRNLKKLFKDMGLRPYYDVILKDVVVAGCKVRGDNWQAVLRSEVLSEAIRTGLDSRIVDWHYNSLMMKKEKNPLLKAVMDVEWDGEDHLATLSSAIAVKGDRDYMQEGLKRWLVQAVAAWDGARKSPRRDALAKYELVLVMQSAQGVKKTSFFGRLLPGKLRKYFQDGASLHTKDKDSVMSLLGHGIVELGELDATFKKSDISDIKSFTSKQTDKIRPPYGKDLLSKPRRTVMCSSVNDAQFLNDPSGARRFFVLALESLDQGVLDGLDFMQVWAQVWDLYAGGEKWWFEAGEKWVAMRDAENELHRETGLYGDITVEFAQKLKDGHIFEPKMSASDIFEAVAGRSPTQTEAVSLARELVACGMNRNSARYFSSFKEWAFKFLRSDSPEVLRAKIEDLKQEIVDLEEKLKLGHA